MSDEQDIPLIVDCVVELAVVRMRVAVGPTRQQSYLPRACLWVDHQSGLVLNFELSEPLPNYLPLVVDSLKTTSERLDGLPREIQMRDPELAADLREVLDHAGAGVEVVVRESLPMLDAAVAGMQEFKSLAGEREPGVFDMPGMTLGHVTAFAQAAKAFYEAAPWRHLIDDDLIAIESPLGPPGTEFAQVLGAGGAAIGVGFTASQKAHDELRNGQLPKGNIWSLLFETIDGLPFDDGERWQQHRLALAGPHVYPDFVGLNKSRRPIRPTPEQLIWAEGLLRALAGTTEEELDLGRWEKRVETFGGVMTYTFSMPVLLEQMAGKTEMDPAADLDAGMEPLLRTIEQQLAEHKTIGEAAINEFLASANKTMPKFIPTTNAEQAQALCYQAHASVGRRRLQLAREALAIDPDCCDALLLLAERSSDAETALPLIRRAVEAGEQGLGPARFENDAGDFWGLVETRPYMRARRALALALLALGKFQEAAGHFEELLRLNPHDNQGNRYDLAQCLLNGNQLDRLDELLNRSQYRDDFAAEWAFTRTLLDYRRMGDTPEARKRLDEAQSRNRFVAPLLTGRMELPPIFPSYFSPGSEDEAIIAVGQIVEGWQGTEGAIQWLDSRVAKVEKRVQQWERERKKKRKRR